jgi:hypothetical protein
MAMAKRVERRGSKPGEGRGGRPPGARDRKTLEREQMVSEVLAAASAAIGSDKIEAMSPLDVLLFAMRLCASNGWWFKAAVFAEDAAPYVHPRLASAVIEDQRRRAPEDFHEDELMALSRADEPGVTVN